MRTIDIYRYAAAQERAKQWADEQGDKLLKPVQSRLDKIRDEDLSGEIWDFLLLVNNLDNAYTPAERLYFVIVGHDEHNRIRSASAEFWEQVFDESQPDLDLLGGFATGLLPEDSPIAL